ncbi:hypothetical protein GCM10027598_59840 [Amycolatopsis oliviviridis]|uniref:Uncharacterized protein n=1 Tax=Amycolatopsis oliviviridis TaxID=1471590 RepID=A0ABQ3LXS2_9PSEU|nr:hypothetical protein GCM10017790_60490 [Amycolatopsis oliviviridis]
MLGALGEYEGVEIRPRDTQVFGLAAVVGAHARVSVRGTGTAGVRTQAETGQPLETVVTALVRP